MLPIDCRRCRQVIDAANMSQEQGWKIAERHLIELAKETINAPKTRKEKVSASQDLMLTSRPPTPRY